MKKRSSNRLLISFLIITLASILAPQCSTSQFRHKYMMKGHIVKQAGNDYYLCIGTKDGAKVGDELKVYHYRVVELRGPDSFKRPPEGHKRKYSFKKIYTGTLKIMEIVDEHFAVGSLISGKAEVGYAVELE